MFLGNNSAWENLYIIHLLFYLICVVFNLGYALIFSNFLILKKTFHFGILFSVVATLILTGSDTFYLFVGGTDTSLLGLLLFIVYSFSTVMILGSLFGLGLGLYLSSHYNKFKNTEANFKPFIKKFMLTNIVISVVWILVLISS